MSPANKTEVKKDDLYKIRDRYETLRRYALHQDTMDSPPKSLSVFLHRGIAGWIKVINTECPQDAKRPLKEEGSRGAENKNEVVLILSKIISKQINN